MKCPNFKFVIFLFAILSFCIFSSCEESLEEDTLIPCDNRTRVNKLTGNYVGNAMISTSVGWFGDFTFSLVPSNDDCLKIGFRNTQGWSDSFVGELSGDRFVLSEERTLQKTGDRCTRSYGLTKSVTLSIEGSIIINEDKEPIEMQLNSFTQTIIDNEDGAVLCEASYTGILVKQ